MAADSYLVDKTVAMIQQKAFCFIGDVINGFI